MIILDTNILSALMLAKPDPQIVAWLDRQDPDLVWITAITVFEIQYGIGLLTTGRKKEKLLAGFEEMLRYDYRNRILDFDTEAALAAGELAAACKKNGCNTDMRDLQIAGIAKASGAYLATRNIKDFTPMGIALLNPWEK